MLIPQPLQQIIYCECVCMCVCVSMGGLEMSLELLDARFWHIHKGEKDPHLKPGRNTHTDIALGAIFSLHCFYLPKSLIIFYGTPLKLALKIHSRKPHCSMQVRGVCFICFPRLLSTQNSTRGITQNQISLPYPSKYNYFQCQYRKKGNIQQVIQRLTAYCCS